MRQQSSDEDSDGATIAPQKISKPTTKEIRRNVKLLINNGKVNENAQETELDLTFYDQYLEAGDILGGDLCISIMEDTRTREYVYVVCDEFRKFARFGEDMKAIRAETAKIMQILPADMRGKPLFPYVVISPVEKHGELAKYLLEEYPDAYEFLLQLIYQIF